MKLDIRKFNPSILRNATLICDGKGYMRTYNLHNGLIYKEVKSPDESYLSHYLYHDDFVTCLEKKLKLASSINSSFLVLPNRIYMDSCAVVGYTVPFLDLDSFIDVLEKTNDFPFLIESFILLSQAVKECNKDGIIFPDLGNVSNVLYNPKTKEIKFIDYDGLQIGDCESFNVSSIMRSYCNPVFEQTKYFDKHTSLFTTNFDKASLMAIFIYIATGTNITRFFGNDFEKINGLFSLKKEVLFDYLNSIGLLDSPLLEDICLIYDNGKNNNYIETSIKRLSKSHDLDFHNLRFYKKQ